MMNTTIQRNGLRRAKSGASCSESLSPADVQREVEKLRRDTDWIAMLDGGKPVEDIISGWIFDGPKEVVIYEDYTEAPAYRGASFAVQWLADVICAQNIDWGFVEDTIIDKVLDEGERIYMRDVDAAVGIYKQTRAWSPLRIESFKRVTLEARAEAEKIAASRYASSGSDSDPDDYSRECGVTRTYVKDIGVQVPAFPSTVRYVAPKSSPVGKNEVKLAWDVEWDSSVAYENYYSSFPKWRTSRPAQSSPIEIDQKKRDRIDARREHRRQCAFETWFEKREDFRRAQRYRTHMDKCRKALEVLESDFTEKCAELWSLFDVHVPRTQSGHAHRRYVREEQQKRAAKQQALAEKRAVPKRERKQEVRDEKKAAMVQRLDVQTQGGLHPAAAMACAGVVGAAIARAASVVGRSVDRATAKADTIMGSIGVFFNSLKDQLINIFGRRLWIVPALIIILYMYRNGDAGRDKALLILSLATPFLAPELYSTVSEFFRKGKVETQSGTEPFTKLLSTVLCFSIFGSKCKDQLGEFAKRVANIERVSSGFEALMEWMFRGIQAVMDYVAGMFGKEAWQIRKDKDKLLTDWFKDVKRAEISAAACDVMPSSKLPHTYIALLRRGEGLTDSYRHDKYLSGQIATAINIVKNLLVPLSGAMNAANNYRPEPIFGLFRGNPGIGKTVMTQATVGTVLSASGILGENPTDEDIQNNMFQRGSSDYWNGYIGQEAHILDDAFQMKAFPGDKENEYMMVIHAVGSWAFPLNFADLVSKGKIYYTSRLVFGSTNMKGLKSEADLVINCPEAFARRIRYGYELVLNPEFATPCGKYMDMEKLQRAIHKMEGGGLWNSYPWHAWSCYKWDYMTAMRVGPEEKTVDVMKRMAFDLGERTARHAENRAWFKRYLSNLHKKTERSQPEVESATPVAGAPIQRLDSELLHQHTFCNPLDVAPYSGSYSIEHCPMPVVDGVTYDWDGTPFVEQDHAYDPALYPPSGRTVDWVRRNSFSLSPVQEEEEIVSPEGSVCTQGLPSLKKVVTSYFVGKQVFKYLKVIDKHINTVYVQDRCAWKLALTWVIPTLLRLSAGYLAWQGACAMVRLFFGNKEEDDYDVVSFEVVAKDVKSVSQMKQMAPRPMDWSLLKSKTQSNRPLSHPAKVRKGHAVLQSGTVAVTNLAYANSFKVMVTSGTNFWPLGQLTMLNDQLAMMPYHFGVDLAEHLEQGLFSEDDTVTLKNAKNLSFELKCSVRTFLAFERVSWPNLDVEFVKMKLSRSCRNITSSFIKESDLRHVTGYQVRIDTCDIDQKGGIVQDKDRKVYWSPAVKVGGYFHNGAFAVERHLKYNAPTVVGDCGGLVSFVEAPCFQGRVVLGFHTAGTISNGEAFGSIITQEMIADAREKLCTINDTALEDTARITQAGIVFTPSDDFPFTEMGSFLPIGVLSKGPTICPKTSYFKTKHFGVFGAYDHEPAMMTPTLVDGKMVYPLENAVKPYSSPVQHFEQPWLKTIMYVSMKKLRECTKGDARTIFTFDEAVLGVPAKKFRSVPRGTAAGFPYVYTVKNGKTEFFGTDDDYKLDLPKCEELRGRVAEILKAAAKGERLLHVFVDFPKDELRTLKKVRAAMTRLISSAPLDYVIAFRQMFGAFSSSAMMNNTRTGMAPGICTYSDWHNVVNMLHRHGRKVFAGDFKQFDASEQPCIHDLILDVINAWYDDGEENALIRRVLWLELTHSRHVGGLGKDQRFVYQWSKSLPSGHPATTIVNSMYSLFCIVAAYYKTTGDLTGFWENASAVTYGDDNGVGVADLIAHLFNQLTTAEALMEEFGMVYTSDQKDAELSTTTDITGITFLKRGFAFEKGKVLCPLDIDSFMYTVYWCKNRMLEDKIAVDVLEIALQELSLHPQNIWDEKAPQVYTLLSGLDEPKCPLDRACYLGLVQSRTDSWF